MILYIYNREKAGKILNNIVGNGKKITTKKSIEVVFSGANGDIDCDLQKKYLIELNLVLDTEVFLDVVSKERINEFIMITWNYDDSKGILRTMFKQTDKYINNK